MGRSDRLDSSCKENEGIDCVSLKSILPPFLNWVPSPLEKGEVHITQQYLRSVNLMGTLNAEEYTLYMQEWKNVV